MISKITIQNFKSLKNVELECSNLNLLTGLNGMGKSSILQALLLLRQSHEKGSLQRGRLNLVGDLVNIGIGKDAFCQSADVDIIGFDVSFRKDLDLINHVWKFSYTDSADSDVLNFIEEELVPENLDEWPLFNLRWQYLNADRWVRNFYDRSTFQVEQNESLGKHGEYTAHYLDHNGAKKVAPALLYSGTTTDSLQHQVSEWLTEISPGVIVNVEKVRGHNMMKLGYEFKKGDGRTDEISATNAGFGMTYVLPVVVALLSAKPGDILLIENPESHLHPQGQSAIARLMALSAQQGVQLFVESHSDHILNGILVSINQKHKNEAPGIDSKNVSIYFVERNSDTHTAIASPINVLENGRIKSAPRGFFDQFSKDMKAIMGF